MTIAPEHVLTLLDELEAVGSDALAEDVERLGEGVDSLVVVPYLARGVLVALGGRAEEVCVLADGGGRGLAAEASISKGMGLGNEV